jgi:hypothetical protein
MASVPTGGIVSAAGASVSVVSADVSAAKAKEEKKESDDVCLYCDLAIKISAYYHHLYKICISVFSIKQSRRVANENIFTVHLFSKLLINST